MCFSSILQCSSCFVNVGFWLLNKKKGVLKVGTIFFVILWLSCQSYHNNSWELLITFYARHWTRKFHIYSLFNWILTTSDEIVVIRSMLQWMKLKLIRTKYQCKTTSKLCSWDPKPDRQDSKVYPLILLCCIQLMRDTK